MTVTLSPPHCHFSLSDLCDRRSCCVTANQLMTKFVSISCATLPWAAAVLSMGVNVPRIFVNVPNARIFATTAGNVGSQRESGRSMVLGCSPPLSSPNPAEAGKGTHHHHYYLHMACIHVHCCLPVDMMLRQRLRLDDQY